MTFLSAYMDTPLPVGALARSFAKAGVTSTRIPAEHVSEAPLCTTCSQVHPRVIYGE